MASKKNISVFEKYAHEYDLITNAAQREKYHRKEVSGEVRDEYAKKEDDYVDVCLWAHWGIHPAKGGIETIGEYEY